MNDNEQRPLDSARKLRGSQFVTQKRAEKIEAIRSRIARKPKIIHRSERRQIAQNLWTILTDLEKAQKVRKLDVVRASGLGTDLESTKRLYTCSLPPDLDDITRERREKNLVHNTEKYLRIVTSAAKLAGADPDLLLDSLFRGTSYGSDEIAGDEISPSWARALVDILNRMAEWVSQRNDLSSYFELFSSNQLGVDDCGFNQTFRIDFSAIETGYAEEVTIGNSLPSVAIASSSLESFTVQYAEAQYRPDGVVIPLSESTLKIMEFEAKVCSELGIVLAPIGPTRTIRPLFCKSVSKSVYANGKKIGSEEGYLRYTDEDGNYDKPLTEWDLSWFAKRDELGFRTNDDDWHWERAINAENNFTPKMDPDLRESCIRYYRPVDVHSVVDLLGFNFYEAVESWRLIIHVQPSLLPTEAPRRTLASVIESNLYGGSDKERLDSRLDAIARALVARAHEFLEESKREIASSRQALLARYSYSEDR